jgi:hypothetical protein
MSELKIKVENYVGFSDDGDVEYCCFVGNGDTPIIDQKVSLKKMINEFIDVRSVMGKLPTDHFKEAQKLLDVMEEGIKTLKATMTK